LLTSYPTRMLILLAPSEVEGSDRSESQDLSSHATKQVCPEPARRRMRLALDTFPRKEES
jgi:hypothetical protein